MFRITFISLIAILLLSACAGGISGVQSSSAFGYWQVYKVSYHSNLSSGPDYSTEDSLEYLFFSLGFKSNGQWHSPLLNYSRVNTFKQPYKDRYIRIVVEISEENIILMSTSYSPVTKSVFNSIESELNELFGESNVAQCYGIKDIYGHSCFQGDTSGADLTKLFSEIFNQRDNP